MRYGSAAEQQRDTQKWPERLEEPYWPGWLNRETTGAETAPADRLRGMTHLVQAGDLEGQIAWRAPPPSCRPRSLALNLQNCSLE
jgi:hypothetical protein